MWRGRSAAMQRVAIAEHRIEQMQPKAIERHRIELRALVLHHLELREIEQHCTDLVATVQRSHCARRAAPRHKHHQFATRTMMHIQCPDVRRSTFEAQRVVDDNFRLLQILNEKRR